MKTPHTPGPWTTQELEHAYHGYENWNTYCIRSPQNVHIATVGNVDRYHEQDHEANARLIAAAPDLLAALQEVELRLTQAKIASKIGKPTLKDADFLRGECERTAAVARQAINKAKTIFNQ